MSFVTVIVVLNKRVYVANCHYRTALRLLENPDMVKVLKRSWVLDGGYIVFDADKKQVISSQLCFPARVLKNVEVFEF